MGLLPQLETCCCVCSLRTGSILAGWWGTINGILTTIVYVCLITDPSQPAESKVDLKTTALITTIALVILAPGTILKVLFSIALLIGINRGRPSMFLPWIIYSTISLIHDIWRYIAILAYHVYVYRPLVSFFYPCVFAYFILVVYSYYREIRKN